MGATPSPGSFLPLPHLTYQVLLSLARAPLHGYAIAKEVEERCAPGSAPSTGSLYLAMGRLQESSLIEKAGKDGRRILYRMTRLGRSVAEAETARLQSLVAVAESRDLAAEPGREG